MDLRYHKFDILGLFYEYICSQNLLVSRYIVKQHMDMYTLSIQPE
jgi:hypothetical protein